jgi:glycerophosphoryl diester phosphodiesterase
VRLDIELKCAPATSPAALVDAVLAAIAAAHPVTPPSLRSFHWPALRLIHARDPAIPLAWLTPSGSAPSAVAGEIAQCGWPAWQPVWAPDHRTLLKRDIQQARGLGLAVKPWTVNDPARMRQLLAWGAAGLCTDFPDRCLEIARSW